MATRPSETRQGLLWLANFTVDERRAAILLIDSLRIVSSSRFRIAMSDALRAMIAEFLAPVGVYPVRELPGNISVPFPPLDLPYASLPGSEGLVGNVIREVVGRRPKFNLAASYDSLERLRRNKVRTLLLVDDYSGTGNQIVKYVDAWMRHPTIKSWHSYGAVRVHILLLAASAQAHHRLNSHRFVTSASYLERGLGFDTAPWTDGEREEIEALCRRYAHKPEYALGYGESRGLLALHHTIPNNLPHILWQAKCPRARHWNPFFADRSASPQLQLELDDYRLETDPTRIARIIRQEGLGKALDAQSNPTVRNFLMVLGAVESGFRDPMKIGDLLGLSLETTRLTLGACRSLALLNTANRLTDEGRSELRRARNRPPTPDPGPPAPGDKAPYYPRALRGAT